MTRFHRTLRYTAHMKATIQNGAIQFSEIPHFPKFQWAPLLDELKAEHVPGLYQAGQRMHVAIVDGKVCTCVYLTDKPSQSKILEILGRHGIKDANIASAEQLGEVKAKPPHQEACGPRSWLWRPCNRKNRQSRCDG